EPGGHAFEFGHPYQKPQWRAGYVARRSRHLEGHPNPIRRAAMEGGLRSPPERSTQNVPLTWRFGGGIER
ncbi:MAG: hypothetical protein OXH33_04690, partial [bacterium]|nr:hypothetical protein [bacterium]